MIAHNCGVAELEGELRFTTNEGCMDHVVADSEAPVSCEIVKVTSLDKALKEMPINVLKIDVEGFETPVLSGARNIMSDSSLHSVIIELNGSGKRYGYSDEALVATMNRFGFSEYEYRPFERVLRKTSPGSAYSGNSIFVRDFDLVSKRLAAAPQFEVFGCRI